MRSWLSTNVYGAVTGKERLNYKEYWKKQGLHTSMGGRTCDPCLGLGFRRGPLHSSCQLNGCVCSVCKKKPALTSYSAAVASKHNQGNPSGARARKPDSEVTAKALYMRKFREGRTTPRPDISALRPKIEAMSERGVQRKNIAADLGISVSAVAKTLQSVVV